MYESFYGLKEKPFSMQPDPGFLYLSKKHQKALTLFEYGLMNRAGFCVISGEIGSGKTTLLRKLLDNMSRRLTVGMITNTHKQFGELLDWVLSAFDIHEKGLNEVEKHQRFIDFLLEQYAAKKTTLLIVDEAQNMTPDKLEELRMLSNINTGKDQVLQVMLAGQPELKDTLHLPELKQFVQRISVDYHLGSLNEEETLGYIEHRLSVAGADKPIFTKAACEMLYKYSGGTPRLLNLLCDTAMVYGFADQEEVIDEDLVAEMIIERMQDSLVPLACTEPPKKKARKSVSEESAPPVETPTSNDFGEKVLQASTPEDDIENQAQVENIPEVEIATKQEENIPALEEDEQAILFETDSSTPPPSEKQENYSNFMMPLAMGLAALVIIVLIYALSLDGDNSTTPDVNEDNTVPAVIEQGEIPVSPEPEQLAPIPVVPDEVKKQLDEAKKIQGEMELRQQQDSAKLKALEEQAALLESERDQALKKAKIEEQKRLSEEKAAQIAAEKAALAKRVADEAIAEAASAARVARMMEELRIKDELAKAAVLKAAALKAEQEALDKQRELEAVQAAEEAEKKASEDARCDGPTARFLSICR